jgi:hypothetical protein
VPGCPRRKDRLDLLQQQRSRIWGPCQHHYLAGYAAGTHADLSQTRFLGIITSGEYQWAVAYLAPGRTPPGDGRASHNSIGLGVIPSVVDQSLATSAKIDIPYDAVDSPNYDKTLRADREWLPEQQRRHPRGGPPGEHARLQPSPARPSLSGPVTCCREGVGR